MIKRDKLPVTGFTLPELESVVASKGEPKYQAKQILDWVYHKLAGSFEAMTNLPLASRQKLDQYFIISSSRIKEVRTSRDGTKKCLIELCDGKGVEMVVMENESRTTLCISSQVGCPVRCRFCASGRKGLIGSLQSNEMVEEVYLAGQLLRPVGKRINNIMIMGMGEPLMNYDNLVKALTTITAKWGFGIGLNHITISTVGLPRQIRQLSKEKVAPNLAISLHAPNETIRRQIIPQAKLTSISEIIKSARAYQQATGKEITFEYLMIEGLNSAETAAEGLARLLNSGEKVNLIPYNMVPDLPYRTPDRLVIERFQDILRRHNIMAFIRKSKGQDIDAACGQLAARLSAAGRPGSASGG